MNYIYDVASLLNSYWNSYMHQDNLDQESKNKVDEQKSVNQELSYEQLKQDEKLKELDRKITMIKKQALEIRDFLNEEDIVKNFNNCTDKEDIVLVTKYNHEKETYATIKDCVENAPC